MGYCTTVDREALPAEKGSAGRFCSSRGRSSFSNGPAKSERATHRACNHESSFVRMTRQQLTVANIRLTTLSRRAIGTASTSGTPRRENNGAKGNAAPNPAMARKPENTNTSAALTMKTVTDVRGWFGSELRAK